MLNGSLIEEIALRYLGTPYTKSFDCLAFVRAVYAEVGLTVPPIELNLTADQLEDPPIGYALHLRHKRTSPERRATHIAIVISGRRCVHCSYYWGLQVVVTPLSDLLEVYDPAI